MTINKILEEVRGRKPLSEIQLRRHMSRLKIKPLGCRQRPQNYPDDTAAKILEYLGIVPLKTNGHAQGPDDGKLVPLKKLKQVRASARKAA